MLEREETLHEVKQLSTYLNCLNGETDRGAALVAASMLDETLHAVLSAFLSENRAKNELLNGVNAPLGTFSSRALAAWSLALIQKNEFDEITIIRKIRNEFGHSWKNVSFNDGKVAAYCKALPWRGPEEYEANSSCRVRFNSSVALLLVDLMWRVKLVNREQRKEKSWPNKLRD